MDAAFRAVADPSRRAILELLLDGERAAGDLLRHFSFSQPALSRHLRVLRESGWVEARAAGRERIYALREDALRAVAGWLHPFERAWRQRLDALGEVLDAMPEQTP